MHLYSLISDGAAATFFPISEMQTLLPFSFVSLAMQLTIILQNSLSPYRKYYSIYRNEAL